MRRREEGKEYQRDGIVRRAGDRLVGKGDGVTDGMSFENHCKENTNLKTEERLRLGEDERLTRLIGVHVKSLWSPR